MNALEFFSVLVPTFSFPLISYWYFDSNGSLMHKKFLSIFGRRCFTKFNNTLVFPDPEPPVIKIL